MNNYLLYTQASVGEKASSEEIAYIRRLTRRAYDMAQKVRTEKGLKTEVERLTEVHGEDAVFRSGYRDGRYHKPIIIRFIDVDCFGDKYEKVPIVDYADRQYDFKGLTEDSLRAYLKGHNFSDIGSAAGGAILLVAEEITMERMAEKLVSEPRTYTLRAIKRIGRPGKGVFYTVRNGEATDEGIADEMLTGEKAIRQQLLDAGVLKKYGARMMTPEEIAETEKKKRSD